METQVDSKCPVRCKCGLESVIRTAKTDQNRMRQFFGCCLYKSKKEPGCGFGRWVDNAGSYQKAKERFVGNVAVLVDEEITQINIDGMRMRGQTSRRFII
ncbi:hypothetical protein L484_019825 [Morus notabilis]|uniref:GRF-type domain-containing protein n=1 Tax=Morus notabilis TaxID=981085 RepID=W9S4G2_9ROSA|nr:hypothetical protein L484_019825 [Morus notabilis]